MKDRELNTLEFAPFGYIYLNDELQVQFSNRYAQKLMHCKVGSNILELLHPDSRENFDELIALGNPDISKELQLLLDIGTKEIQAFSAKNKSGGLDLFIQNISETKVLGRQLQENSKPARKFVHDISNALASTIGFSELLTMMLSDGEMFAGEKLNAIRRYQNEISEGLAKAELLIRRERARKHSAATPARQLIEASRRHTLSSNTANPNDAATAPSQDEAVTPIFSRDRPSNFRSVAGDRTSRIRRHIVIVDDESSIADFLAELMRSRHYKTTVFTSSSDAYDYLLQNDGKVDLVLLDQLMPSITGIDLATNLLSMGINIPIVLCTGDRDLIASQSKGVINIKHFVSKPIDITELMDLVGSIIS